ncbi:flavin reductase, partial [Staphylococcus capitis]|nr:flavin reductase [Staphylococcus capitis]
MTGMPENCAQAQFASLMCQLDQPVYVVTVRGADGPAGCLVGFAGQVSIDPPLFLAGLSEKNHTWRASQQASHLAVHIIPRAEDELVHLFGELTGDSVDKFARCTWRDGPHGVPILEQSA